MGSLALAFGLLFLTGLLGGVYKTVSRREGALKWFASSCLGLVLYVSLLFVAAGRNGPGKSAVPASAGANRAVANENAGVVEQVYQPANGPAPVPNAVPNASGRNNAVSGSTYSSVPNASGRNNTVSKSTYPSYVRTLPGSTVKTVYGSKTRAASMSTKPGG